ncbi:DeoR/GlpR family DNA-binding transcription regulator [Luteolibacter sp. AS25]|uniref:DeoR/GlpR family DNA-binding transcription regulator n=1 Tax=Luteolibacter sp. AS25 TaxID=3135776 RepID=UPI00398B6E8B
MLAIERQRKILDTAKREGAVRTQELASSLGVTEETVRRDLDTLSRQGLLRRTHGGAADISMVIKESTQTEREARQAAEKTTIARLAAKKIGDNETIMLDASSTTLELAHHIPKGKEKLRVLTYSHDVVEKLSVRSDIELILLGGVFEPKGRRFMGMLTEIGIRTFNIDRFFFSGHGYDTTLGVGEPNPEESRLKATAMTHARWKCALMDHTKLGRKTDHFFVKPEEIDLFITDSVTEAFRKSMEDQGIKILSA